MKKILFIPPGINGGWYLENYYEYLIRYLSDEFFIEMAYVPYPDAEPSPYERNPDNYDLLIPLLPSHWGIVERDKYKDKVAVVMYEPGEGDWWRAKHLASATDVVDNMDSSGRKLYPVRFGVDVNHFHPIKMQREDDLLHVGVVGTLHNPRRQLPAILNLDIPGVRLMLYTSKIVPETDPYLSNLPTHKKFFSSIVTGNRSWVSMPNIYNQLDVLVRVDDSYGVSFPVLEAAACGIPVITTYQGIDHHITEAGGGIMLMADDASDEPDGMRWPKNHEDELTKKLTKAIVYLRDHPIKRKRMGVNARNEIVSNWQWQKQIPAWRKFLREVTR